MSKSMNRRRFLKSSIQIGGGLAAALYAGGGSLRASQSPNERLNLAAVGVANKGRHNIDQMKDQAWIAFCDVDENFLNQSAADFAGVRKFRDYRRMFDELGDQIDGVVVSTADHTHAPVTSIALELGKHVYCEKPLTHTVAEARTIARLAASRKVATQMGIQIHAEDNYRRVVELVQSGAIGPISQVYTWCNKGWSDGRFAKGIHAQPTSLDWNLWLGPAPNHPFYPRIHPADWRRFWEFGSGTFGDMACHVMDLPFWALNLQYPNRIRSEGPDRHADGAPRWCRASYEFTQPDGKPLKYHWADGGENFDLVKETKDADGKSLADWGLGTLFVGDRGMLVADYGRRQLLPKDQFEGFEAPEPTIERSIGHWNEWIQACKTGSSTTCNFEYAARLTETVLLGIVAYRSATDVVWDATNMSAVDNPRAQAFVSKQYRRGFGVVGLES